MTAAELDHLAEEVLSLTLRRADLLQRQLQAELDRVAAFERQSRKPKHDFPLTIACQTEQSV